MSRAHYPVTQAVRLLRRHKVDYRQHLYTYIPGGGSEVCARELGLDLHSVVKTLVFETSDSTLLLVLMHGDREVSVKTLARLLQVKSILPATPETAHKATGYQVGGISPFGTRLRLPVYAQQTIFDLSLLAINGGRRGFILTMDPKHLQQVLNPVLVDAATPA